MILRRAHRQGIGMEETFRFWFWMYVCAMAGAHFYKVLVDDFSIFAADPSLLFRVNAGISSAGALNGGLWPGLLWCRYRGLSWRETLRRLDLAAYVIPVAFLFGRLGCALAHDHPGVPSTSWIAVQFPEGPRLDLGLIEFLFLIGLSALFWILDRRPWPPGFFFGLFGVVYGGFRIWLGTLRLEPDRFHGGAGILIGLAGWAAMLALERNHRHDNRTPGSRPPRAQRPGVAECSIDVSHRNLREVVKE
jgi:phosphatidylglycerol:prolipoprotein diacylglycerol transferase